MAAQQSYLIEGKDSEVINLYVELSITTTSVVGGSFSSVTTFGRAFTTAPRVLGNNTPRSGANVTAAPTTTLITIWVVGSAGTPLADGQLLCSATLQGRLA